MDNIRDVTNQLEYIKFQIEKIKECVERPSVYQKDEVFDDFIFNKVLEWYKGKYGEKYPDCKSSAMVVRRKYVEVCHILGVEPTVRKYYITKQGEKNEDN